MAITPDDIRSIRSAEGVAALYHHLGYEADLEPEGYSAAEAYLTGAAAQGVSKVYPLSQLGDLQHYHVESTDLSSYRLRQLADNFVARPGTCLLSVASTSYDRVIFIKPSRAQGKTKISKLTVQPATPTAHDASILRAIAVNGPQSAASVHEAQVRAFDVERVTRDFYRVYHDLFYKLLTAIKEHNPDTRIGPLVRNTTEDKPSLHAFTQRLLSRVMFLYFIQKKGWLDGKRDYLSRLYRESVTPQTNFYRDLLEPLFFTLLNNPERNQDTSPFGNVPYLNGSLFEREYPLETQLELPNTLFDPREDGSVFDVFDGYNFTINESSSLDQEVSLDPEMLGKVFENMMEAEEAAKNGTFYTPRSIVQFLAEESISRYLADKTEIDRERLMKLLGEDDSYGDISIAEANKIITALAEVRVLDPAVGTASMLVGTLNVLVGIRRSAEARLGVKVKEGSPRFSEWKREYINHCLYGVDIKQEAIEIGRLRLWLSLVVDAQEPEPLPNLDYKLMAGDGLLESIEGTPFINVQEGVVGQLGEIRQLTHDIEALHTEFFTEQDPVKRNEYRKGIQEKERELFRVDIDQRIEDTQALLKEIDRREKSRKGDEKKSQNLLEFRGKLLELRREVWDEQEPLPFFLHSVHFSEVMKGKGGFDIIIGNPPYVSIGNMELVYKTALRKAFPEVESGRSDLYVYFYKKGFELLNSWGYLAFITPNKFLRAGYGAPLRRYMSTTISLKAMVDFGDLPVFDATTYPLITIAQKATPRQNAELEVLPEATLKRKIGDARKQGVSQVRHSLTSFHKYARDLTTPYKQSSLKDAGWVLEDLETLQLFARLSSLGKPLGTYVDRRIFYGIKTGLNEAFVIDRAQFEDLITEDPNSKSVLKPFLRGKDIERWRVKFAGKYLIFAKRGFQLEAHQGIKRHLQAWRLELEKRVTVPASHPWYELQQPQEGIFRYFDRPKIVYPHFAKRPSFASDPSEEFYGNDKTYFIPDPPSWMISVLNSNLISFIFSLLSPPVQGGYFEHRTQYVERLPIVEPMETVASRLESFADGSQFDELNKLVYKLYGVNNDEIKIIESHLMSVLE